MRKRLWSRLAQVLHAHGQEARGDELLVALRVAGGGQQVAGQLLADELVVRLVLVERIDDPVAIAKRQRKRHIADCCRWTPHSGPHRASAVPSARRSAGWPAARSICDCEFRDCSDRLARAAGPSDRSDPPAQSTGDASATGCSPFASSAGEHEAVNVRARPRRVLHSAPADSRSAGRPSACVLPRCRSCWSPPASVARIGRAHRDPLLEIRDHRLRQLFLRRHLRDLVGVANGRQATGFAGHRPAPPPAPVSPPRWIPRVSSSRPPLTFFAFAEWHS